MIAEELKTSPMTQIVFSWIYPEWTTRHMQSSLNYSPERSFRISAIAGLLETEAVTLS
jgi:hypothetical protein